MGKQFIMRVFFKWLLGSSARCFAATSKTILGQSLLLMLFFLGWASTAQAVIPASERAVLTNLYASTNGASWTNNTGWNGGVGTECTWYGVQCDGAQSHVTGIYLYTNHLIGTLPSLTGLTALQRFGVTSNQLTGSIPSLSGLTALQEFYVSANQLTGSIPSLSGLTALQIFWAGGNQITGSIPSLNGLTALQYFNVQFNQLAGSIPSLGGLTALQAISVNNNQLTGSIPSLSGLTALGYFDVGGNQLSGPVPAPPPSLNPGYTNLCGNRLVSSGNPAIDAAWVTTTGTNWLACQISAGSPTCTLTASPASIPAGSASTLTASCSPAATSYRWTGGTCAGTSAASCTVTPSASTTYYTVAGISSAGTGAAVSVTVTVTCPAGPSAFSTGKRIMAVALGANVRNAQLATVLFQQAGGVHGTITGGPVCGTAGNPSYTGNWWQISWDSEPPNQNGIQGWSAESVILLAPLAGDVAQPDLSSRYYASSDNHFWTQGDAPGTAVPGNLWPSGALGNCTWYAYGRMLELGYSPAQLAAIAPPHQGTAYLWASNATGSAASALGITSDTTPAVGSIAVRDIRPGWSDGHVAVVESKNADGTITVTESSYTTDATSVWNVLWHHRTVDPTWFDHFIHVTNTQMFSSNAFGPLTARVLTVTVQPTSAALGRAGQVFVAAVAGQQRYFRTALGWQLWTGGGFPAYSSGPLAAQTIQVLDGSLDLSGVVGAQIYVGYGASDLEMIASGRYSLVYTVQ